jgi:hypothetical protein
MQMVEQSFHTADAICLFFRENFVRSFLTNEIKQLRIKVIEALVRADCRIHERDQCAGRQSVLGTSLVKGRFVVVSDVEHEGMRERTLKGGDDAWACGAFSGGWRQVLCA